MSDFGLFSYPHTPSKNPRPISRIQAYIAYLHSGNVLRTSLLRRSKKFGKHAERGRSEGYGLFAS
jgi:hypothetical protein